MSSERGRDEAWDIMREWSGVILFLLIKRPQRVRDCLPWGGGWEDISFNVTCGSQKKGGMCAPVIGQVSLERYLGCDQIQKTER